MVVFFTEMLEEDSVDKNVFLCGRRIYGNDEQLLRIYAKIRYNKNYSIIEEKLRYRMKTLRNCPELFEIYIDVAINATNVSGAFIYVDNYLRRFVVVEFSEPAEPAEPAELIISDSELSLLKFVAEEISHRI